MPVAKPQLNRYLRELRRRAGLRQAEVAAALGISRPAVAQIEAGKRDVSAAELEKLGKLFDMSPTALLAERPANGSEGDELLAALLDTHPELAAHPHCRERLDELVQLARALTDIERRVGVDVYAPGTHGLHVPAPATRWEAVHQGYAAAEEERRRLDLGSAPIRDMAETLATVRIRASKLDLPHPVAAVFFYGPDCGPLVVVNGNTDLAERRFWWAHQFAHALFDRDAATVVCSPESCERLHEIRANAFAARLLVPAHGLQRFLRSIGRDTVAKSASGEVDVLSDVAAVAANDSRVRVSGKSRRGASVINPFELSQAAHYFGVSRSLMAHVLCDFRFLSDDQRDRLTEAPGRRSSDRAGRALGLTADSLENELDPFVSRLVALTAAARHRELLDVEAAERIADLLRLDGDERTRLIGGLDVAIDEPGTTRASRS